MKGTGRVRWKIDAFLLLVALPLVGAAILCEASEELRAGLDEASHHLGTLFQIQDDLLDLW